MASGASSILVRRLASVYPVGLSLKAWQAWLAAVAQLVECVLGKDEVVGSNPTSSSCCLSSELLSAARQACRASDKRWSKLLIWFSGVRRSVNIAGLY